MEPTESSFEILQPSISHDPLKTRKIIVVVELDAVATRARSTKALRKKGPVYNLGMVVIPQSEGNAKLQEVTGELVYENWTQKHLLAFVKTRVDINDGVVITAEAYEQLVYILGFTVDRSTTKPIIEDRIEEKAPDLVVRALSYNVIKMHHHL